MKEARRKRRYQLLINNEFTYKHSTRYMENFAIFKVCRRLPTWWAREMCKINFETGKFLCSRFLCYEVNIWNYFNTKAHKSSLNFVLEETWNERDMMNIMWHDCKNCTDVYIHSVCKALFNVAYKLFRGIKKKNFFGRSARIYL